MKTGTIRYIHIILETIKHLGHRRSDFLRSLNIPLDFMQGNVIRLPLKTIYFILEKAIEHTNTPHFGLVAGQRGEPLDFGLMAHIWMNAENIEEIFAINTKYSRLMNENLHTALVKKDDHSLFYSDFDECTDDIRDALVSIEFSSMFHIGKHLVGKEYADKIIYQEVHLTSSNTDLKSQYESVFNCPVYLNQDKNFFKIKNEILELKIKNSDFRVKNALICEVERIIPKNTNQKFLDKLTAIIDDRMTNGLPLLSKDIAEAMNMSHSTLKRKLHQLNTTLTEECHKAKYEQSKHLLQANAMSISEIAFKLGFSEPSAFYRFFKEKSGITPKSYQASYQNML